MKNHQHPCKVKYQALTELVICLIPIMLVFVGLLVVGFAGKERVRLIIDTREKAEESINSAFGTGDSFTPILTWEIGDDEVPLSPDDTVIRYGGDDPSYFKVPITKQYLMDKAIGNIPIHNTAFARSQSNFFPSAANLFKGKKSADIFSSYKDESIKSLTEKIFFRKSLLSEEVYIPIIGDGLGY